MNPAALRKLAVAKESVDLNAPIPEELMNLLALRNASIPEVKAFSLR
jgi:hypothetical protein